ncbi:CST complex subunit CTC1-like [Littorina saxatilis]|uniref:CST complex subunit CTC1 n=1 Tax=Littorina saxatilis TaxID=31220 RepID=A0AAN9C114_9CAEN
MEGNGCRSQAGLVITAQDALKFLQLKHILPHRTIVNIKGKVNAVSEIVRINKDCVFLVEIESSITVVVKQPQFHKWHDQLVIDQSFVFINLRPTTLSKAYRPEQRVYVPWTGSRVLSDSMDAPQLSCVSLQDWLQRLGLSLPVNDGRGAEDDREEDVSGSVNCSLTTYQGVVTDNSQAKFNIFQLDNTVRLFLCFLPKLQEPKRLSLGDCVRVNNVHQPTDPQGQGKQLYCCMRSSVQVLHRDMTSEDKNGMRREEGGWPPTPAPLSLLAQFAFMPCDVQPLLQLHRQLSEILHTGTAHRSSEKKDELKEVLQQLLRCSPEGRKLRNYIMEFCQHQTLCPLAHEQNESTQTIPRLTLLKDLISDIAVRVSTDSVSGIPPHQASTSTDDESAWTSYTYTYIEEDKKYLLGWLAVNCSTGRLQLVDSQTAVDVVIVSPQAVSLAQPHQCSSACDCSTMVLGEQLSCPRVHPCCLGHLIMVNKYTVVVETLCKEAESSGESSDKQKQSVVYLLLSTQDCVLVLRRVSAAVLKATKGSGRTSGSGSKETCASQLQRVTTRTEKLPILVNTNDVVYVTNKHYLCSHVKRHKSELQFSVEGFMVNSNDCLTKNNYVSPAKSSQGSPTKKMREAMDVNCNCVKDSDPSSSSCAHSAHSVCSKPSASDCPLSPNTFDTGQPVSLLFESEACGWFDLIHPPGLYTFESKADTPPLVWPQMDAKLKTAMEKARTRMTVNVSHEAVFGRILDARLVQIREEAAITSLQSALSNKSSRLVSFRSVVIYHRHPPCQLPSHEFKTAGSLKRSVQYKSTGEGTLSSLLGTRSLCVGVRDVDNPSVTACIYFNTAALVYPLGLLPGAVVEFQRLDKKTSKANRAYFNFLPVSGLQVLCNLEESKSQPWQSSIVVPQLSKWADTPSQLLIDLWREPRPLDVFVSTCHLCQFLRVSLKSVCVKCGSLFKPEGCLAPACGNVAQSHMLAKFSVLAEDGSSQALVHVNKCSPPDVARKLLKMSEETWQHLEAAVRHQGELFLQKFGYRGGTALDDLLSLLCDSPRVKRPCRLMLRKAVPYDKKHAKVADTVSALHSLTDEELVQRNINTGETSVETLCLPFIQLECLDVMEV